MRKKIPLRRGLTVMELVVVLVVLVALAGILLPMFPSLMTRAHTSSSATNLGEISKAIQTYQTLYLDYPNNFDSLVDASGDYVPYLPGSASADFVAPTALGAEGLAALDGAGITTMAQMVLQPVTIGDWSPTFFPYGASAAVLPTGVNATPLTATTELAELSSAAAARVFGAPVGGRYIVFGLGKYTSMEGKTLEEAPIHFPESAEDAPNVAYCRYGVVFQIADANGDPLEKAVIVGVLAFHDDGVVDLGDHMAEYWNANKK